MAVGSFEPTFHPSESRRLRGVHASVRGSLKRGISQRLHLPTQVHRPPHTAKRGSTAPSAHSAARGADSPWFDVAHRDPCICLKKGPRACCPSPDVTATSASTSSRVAQQSDPDMRDAALNSRRAILAAPANRLQKRDAAADSLPGVSIEIPLECPSPIAVKQARTAVSAT